MEENIMKIYVGTANWGQEYGINKVKVSAKEIDRILGVADANYCGIETAWDYNCMESLRGLGDQFTVIFKGDEPNHFDEARHTIGEIIQMKHHTPYGNYESRSVYNPCDMTWRSEIPLNLVDQRFAEHIKPLIEEYIIARSVFIQGLAFGMPDFHGIPFYHLCWNFVRNNPNIDGIVVGVDTAEQLEDILSIPNYEIDYSRIGGDGWIRTL
jgi:hypothetical protein